MTSSNGKSTQTPAEGSPDLPPGKDGSPGIDKAANNRGKRPDLVDGEVTGSGAGAGGGGAPEDYDSDPVGGGGGNAVPAEGPFGTDPADEKRQDATTEAVMRRGTLGDARPNFDGPDPRTGGSTRPEPVENRPNVSTVKPEDYPLEDRKTARPR